MVTDEAESRKVESQARATIWVDTLNETARDVKKLFPDIDIHARLRTTEDNGGDEDVTRDDDTTGII